MKVQNLQELTSKVTGKIKQNRFIPLTQFIGIKTTETSLRLSATDGSNIISSTLNAQVKAGLDIAVSSELFTKLVSALPGEVEVEISFENDTLIIFNENINYKIPAISDDSGLIRYPEIPLPPTTAKFNRKKFLECYSKVQNAIDPQGLISHLTAVYVSDVMLGTNDHLITKVDCGDLFGQQVLLPLPFCEVMAQMSADEVECYIADGYITLLEPSTIIRGKLHEGLKDYPAEIIKNLFARNIDHHLTFSVSKFTDSVERVSLFINNFEDNFVDIKISDEGATVHSISGSGKEQIKFESSTGENEAIDIQVDVTLLSRLLKSFTSTTVDVTIGAEQIVAKKDDTQVICATAER